MAIDPTERRSRRAVLASAVGGAAALAASQLARPGAALAADVPVNLDVDNPASGTTTITTSAAAAAVVGASTAAANGIGVAGRNTFVSNGTDYSNVGVYGVAGGESPAWTPLDDMETGVFGFSDASPDANGVYGASPQGYGVFGWGDYGVAGDGGVAGVFGVAENGSGVVGVDDYALLPTLVIPGKVGVFAAATGTHVALYVSGRTRFTRSGRTYVSKGKSYADVTVAGGVSSSSQIIATATKYVSGTWIQAAVYLTATKIRVYLNKTATTSVYFSWIVLN